MMICPDAPVSNYIDALRQRGIELKRHEDQLYVIRDPTESLTDGDRQFIRRHKTELLPWCDLGDPKLDHLVGIQQQVSSWPEHRQRQLAGLVLAYQNPDRGFGIRMRPRSREEAIHKAFHELKPIVRQEMMKETMRIQTKR